MIKKLIFLVIVFISFSFSSVILAEPLEEASAKYADCLMQQIEPQIKMPKAENDIVNDTFAKCRQEEQELMGSFDAKKLQGENYKNMSEAQLKLLDEITKGIVKKMREDMSETMLKLIREERNGTIAK
ncbi:hypothetical protein [Acinetobacter sp. 1000160]|uniref:hypothetical protein n=1 Tax=Acinetobacter sp. 1000160 TaxID=1310800 RepID=UPI00044F1800|nr:hypothetical protein [Acinetobacter sp. 1000160]EXB45489.1 hypothetical protein J522_3643 [Acinetobacter baumannii 146457]EYT14762.1 hypothetical protein J699_03555 [Acinetobacter sp. 1000160]